MTIKVLNGDSREILPTLPDKSVNLVLTSPPYYGLRDYGTAEWIGGDPDCEHTGDERFYTVQSAGSASAAAFTEAGPSNAKRLKKARWRERGACTKCGAVHTDKQIGLEETPDEFIAALVEVFRECRRVLRDDGVMLVNIGDSYAGSGKGGNPADSPHQKQKTNAGSLTVVGETAREAALTNVTRRTFRAGAGRADGIVDPRNQRNRNGVTGIADGDIKAKDLIGIPWMLAFALRADGWYLRQDIIWHKPNPMPESVRDRCTKAHEYVFLLSKGDRYLWDAEAIAEKATGQEPGNNGPTKGGLAYEDGAGEMRTSANLHKIGPRETRNKRSVWTIPTEPSQIAHYAMMPTELARIGILAGCPNGGTVLDPFGGAGTTGLVADELQRNAILIELGEDHAQVARDRIRGAASLFAEVS